MSYQDLFDRVVEVMKERSKPENLIETVIVLMIILGIGSIPFVGVPIAVLLFVIMITYYFNQNE